HGLAREVARVVDGVEAWTYLHDTARPRPDLIVLDLNMPRMNGRELLTLIKGDGDLRSIPVVVLTTSAAPDDIDGAYDSYANAYVTKPVSLDAFSDAVHGIEQFFLDTARLPQS
nr:response regulator [Micromonospora sp. DSM 115978]